MSKDRIKAPTSGTRTRAAAGRVRSRQGVTLGLQTFEKISAVEEIHLSAEMRRDILAASDAELGAAERTGLITGKYGKR